MNAPVFRTPYLARHGTIMVLLGGVGGADFRSWYLQSHAVALRACREVIRYKASLIVPPSGELEEILRLSGGVCFCPWEVLAVDSLYGCTWNDVTEFYHDCRVIGAYLTTEFPIRELLTDRPLGQKSPELERLGMLIRPRGVGHADAMRHWIEVHPAKALEHHSGLAAYTQNHVDECLTDDAPDIDGFNSLLYWNLDALRYGHFSRPDSASIIQEDCAHFRSITYTLAAEHYIMKTV